jgi:hypothetical protein
MTVYASSTSVSVSKSKAEIEAILERYGASQFLSGWDADRAVIGFTMPVGEEYRQVRFVLPMPDKSERRFTHHSKGMRTADAALKEWEQACRQRWRALALVIKAKLEAVSAGISIFEDEFLANIVMHDGRTVSEHVRPTLSLIYQGNVQPLLPDFTGGPQ